MQLLLSEVLMDDVHMSLKRLGLLAAPFDWTGSESLLAHHNKTYVVQKYPYLWFSYLVLVDKEKKKKNM